VHGAPCGGDEGYGAVGLLRDVLSEAAVFFPESSVRSKVERLLTIRARVHGARPVVLHAGRFLKVIEWSRNGELVLVLNANPAHVLGASVELSRDFVGKRLVRDGLAEARIIGEDGSVTVDAAPMSYAIYVTENLLVGAPLLRADELVSSAKTLRRPVPVATRRDVPLGWVQAILGAA
jgi:hypothetical protein